MDLAQQLSGLLGATLVTEFGEGHQSRVFDVRGGDGERTVAKVLDATMVRAYEVVARVEAVADLAGLDPRVCRPIPFDGNLVTEVRGDGGVWLLTRYEFAAGTAPDPSQADDARLMGVALAELHASLRRVHRRALPVVAALRAVGAVDDGSYQLLHGDFDHANFRRLGAGEAATCRIFDFDDCGYGPAAFDVANALYMVLFPSMATDDGIDYRSFEEAFLDGYGEADGAPVDRVEIGRLMNVRVDAVRRWLDALHSAPIGIRTASPAWHEMLRTFVRRYEAGERGA